MKKFRSISVFLLLVLWGYMAVMKFYGHAEFRDGLSVSPWVPVRFAPFLSWLLPSLFTACFGLLFEPNLRIWGFRLSSLLLLFFSSYIAWMLITIGKELLPCTCNGLHLHLSWMRQLLINLGFLLLALPNSLQSIRYRRKVKTLAEAPP